MLRKQGQLLFSTAGAGLQGIYRLLFDLIFMKKLKHAFKTRIPQPKQKNKKKQKHKQQIKSKFDYEIEPSTVKC